jgi:hypothetical protein
LQATIEIDLPVEQDDCHDVYAEKIRCSTKEHRIKAALEIEAGNSQR